MLRRSVDWNQFKLLVGMLPNLPVSQCSFSINLTSKIRALPNMENLHGEFKRQVLK